ncbi:MAG: LysM peptidoglycan-binding domain-containing protein [Undibacterium sp.]|nr:LysM peptidoglycan-binding domain-containing protein [Opitutaceae bacterium]
MSKRFWLFATILVLSLGSRASAQVELANLREDVRGLSQRLGELSLKVEQIERENNDLRTKHGSAEKGYATVVQLNDAVSDLNRVIKSAVTVSKNETLQQVAAQMEKLGKQTNSALDSLAKSQATRPAVTTAFGEDYPREGVSYTVQKGDNLATIAKKTGAKQQDIINANKITDPSKINLGQTLFIPVPGNK